MSRSERFSIADRVALVTGASSGNGSEVAKVFAACGSHVIATGRSRTRLDALAARIGEAREPVQADVAAVEGCEGLVANVLAAHPRTDILVNGAGIARVAPPSPVRSRTGTGRWQ